MKIKIVGFKVGKSRPIANRTIALKAASEMSPSDAKFRDEALGVEIIAILDKSDFISIRRVED
ncbi:hypothetical protein MUP79_06870 [Candidatus Bathyarchaeota archaeon]|nr:hypothetical protein [Candidatus Bathyarchaeota archaeon]